LAKYFKRGAGDGFSTGELVDFLAVSSPSILDAAGSSDAEIARAMSIVADLADEEISAAC
jgi:hypothetical protein